MNVKESLEKDGESIFAEDCAASSPIVFFNFTERDAQQHFVSFQEPNVFEYCFRNR